MKTLNKYILPIEEKNIEKIITKAPAHTRHEKNGLVQDLSYAIDYLCKERTLVRAALEGEVVEVLKTVKNNYSGFEWPSEQEFSSKDLMSLRIRNY